MLQAARDPSEVGSLLRLDFSPTPLAVPSHIQVRQREGIHRSLESRRFVSILSGVIIARNDVPTAGLEKLRNQPFPVPSAPELLLLAKSGPHPHSRTTKPKLLKHSPNSSACGPM